MHNTDKKSPTRFTPSLAGLGQESIGLRNQAWSPSDAGKSPIAQDLLSVEWLTLQPDLPVLAQVLPAQKLAALLQAEGLAESVELVEWVRGEQLVAVMDHDLWSTTVSEEGTQSVSLDRFFDWVRVWNEISPEFAAERFLELEEEVMVLLMNELVDIVPVDLENGRTDDDDRFFETLDKKYFLRSKRNDPGAEELCLQFVRSLYGVNLSLAGRVLAYSAMLVRAECQEDAMRWRGGRLADEGFIERSEAIDMLRPKGLQRWNSELRQKYAEAESQVCYPSQTTDPGVLSDAQLRVMKLWNSLPEEQRLVELRGLMRAEEMEQIVGVANPPDHLLESDQELQSQASDRAVSQALKKVRALALRGMGSVSPSSAGQSALLLDDVLASISAANETMALQLRERLARLANAVASLLQNPTSSDSQKRALELLRGTVNLGLEYLLLSDSGSLEPAELALRSSRTKLSSFEDRVGEATARLKQYGLESVFQAGLDVLFELACSAAQTLSEVLERDPNGAVRRLAFRKVGHTADGQELKLSLVELVKLGRYADARSQIALLDEYLPSESSLLVGAFVNRFPVFPLALSETEDGKMLMDLSERRSRVIARLSDWAGAWSAVKVICKNGISSEQSTGGHADAEIEVH